ncbi:hypothetical protein HYU07_07575 [Candidatus Woesearchaeota archaeon]|nr:hypothetical protein [Candidatus Woesearchaeota archaeon]
MKNLEKSFDLKKYIDVSAVDLQEIKKLDKKLKGLDEVTFEIEKLPKKHLKYQKATYLYPRLSTEFLSLVNNEKFRGKIISVPRFGVYQLNDPTMEIEFGINEYCARFTIHNEYDDDLNKHIPDILEYPILRSLINEFSKKEFSCGAEMEEILKESRVPKKVFIKYQKVGNFKIKSTFNTIIPTEIKKRIKQASNLFGIDKLFIIAEIKPEGKNIERIVSTDPLVVGVMDDAEEQEDCFYVAKFDPTPLEKYARAEFIEVYTDMY